MTLLPISGKKIVLLLLAAAFCIVLYIYFPMFVPFILAYLTALLLEPLVKAAQKYLKLPKRLPAVTIVFTLFLAFIALVLYFAVTKLVRETVNFVNQLPFYITEIRLLMDRVILDFYDRIADIPESDLLVAELERQSQILVDKAQSLIEQILPTVTSFVQDVSNFVVVALIYLIALFLVSLDLPNIKSKFYHVFKEETGQKIRYVFSQIGRVFTGFFKAQFLLSLVVFALSYIWLKLAGSPHALIMSVLIWLIDLIPVIGSIVVLAPWALYTFIVGDTAFGIQLLLLAATIIVFRRVSEPKVMGHHIGLSPLATLMSLYFGLYVFGVVGLIVGPLIAIAIRAAVEAEIIKLNVKL